MRKAKVYWRPHADSDEVELLGTYPTAGDAVSELRRDAPAGAGFSVEPYRDGFIINIVEAAG